MNEYEKLWFKANKRYLIASAVAMAAFTAFGGGWLVAPIVYMLAVEVCGINFLKAKGLLADGAAKQMHPAQRRAIYKTYIKLVLLQSAVFAALYAAGTAIGSISGFAIPFVSKIFVNKSSLSTAGEYAFIGALAVLALAVMSGFAVKCSAVKRFMLLAGTVYCPILFEAVYLLFLALAQLSTDVFFVHRVFAITGGAAAVIMLAVLIFSVKRNLEKLLED